MRKTNHCYLHLGSNIEDKKSYIDIALSEIEENIGKIERKSSLFETDAWGKENQDSFYNMAIKVMTILPAKVVLKKIHKIESLMGRERKEHWGARVIDIDIIFYNNEIIQAPDLIVPHPFMTERMFVLRPLMDICSHYVHPIIKKQIRSIYKTCKDPLKVQIINE